MCGCKVDAWVWMRHMRCLTHSHPTSQCEAACGSDVMHGMDATDTFSTNLKVSEAARVMWELMHGWVRLRDRADSSSNLKAVVRAYVMQCRWYGCGTCDCLTHSHATSRSVRFYRPVMWSVCMHMRCVTATA
jgi:hypothetical protein